MTCPICLEKYNKALKSEVKCHFDDCNYSACKECTRTYLTGTVKEPHCMKCRKKWDLEFTKNELNASFMQKEYKTHRQTILADRTIAQIQEYYPAAIQMSQKRKEDAAVKVVQDEINKLHDQINEQYKKINAIRMAAAPPKLNDATEKRKFVMPCQTGGCRGMLSTAYKCDLCEKFTCSKCFESIVGDKDAHTCDPNSVETAEEIRKNTRPCPNCGCRISKIDGCDQMWCIECKTAFSWSKGTVEVGTVHNPHYFQWMRQNGGVPRTDMPGIGCNENRLTTQMSHVREVFNVLSRMAILENEFLQHCKDSGYKDKEFPDVVVEVMNIVNATKKNENLEKYKKIISCEFFTNFYRYIIHTERVILEQLGYNIRNRNQYNTPIHHYILGELTKEELSEYLVKRDNGNARDGAHRDIVEAIVMIGKQILMELCEDLSKVNVDFSWSLLNDQMSMLSRFDRGRDSANYAKAKMIDFAKFYMTFYFNKNMDMECVYERCCSVYEKYKKSVNGYAAYSNAETIRFLLLYGSKKQVYLWDYETETARNFSFSDKDSMIQQIKQFHEEHKKYA